MLSARTWKWYLGSSLLKYKQKMNSPKDFEDVDRQTYQDFQDFQDFKHLRTIKTQDLEEF